VRTRRHSAISKAKTKERKSVVEKLQREIEEDLKRMMEEYAGEDFRTTEDIMKEEMKKHLLKYSNVLPVRVSFHLNP
jgi:hypothetical protein